MDQWYLVLALVKLNTSVGVSRFTNIRINETWLKKKLTYYKCTRFDAVFFLYFYFTMNFSRWIELWLIVKTIFTKNICCQTIVLERYLKQVIISLFRDWIANTHHPWHNINWRSGPVHKSINCLSVLIANQIANFHITINWKFFYFPMKLTKKKCCYQW